MVRVLYGERLTTLVMIFHSPVLNPYGVQVRRGVMAGQKKKRLPRHHDGTAIQKNAPILVLFEKFHTAPDGPDR